MYPRMLVHTTVADPLLIVRWPLRGCQLYPSLPPFLQVFFSFPLLNRNTFHGARSLSIMAAVDISARHTKMVSQPSFKTHATYEALPLMGPNPATKMFFTENVLEIGSSRSSSTLSSSRAVPGLYITGLGSQYPPFSCQSDRLAAFISKWYDLETPG